MQIPSSYPKTQKTVKYNRAIVIRYHLVKNAWTYNSTPHTSLWHST